MSDSLDTRIVSSPVFPEQWLFQVRLYGDVWSTFKTGSIWDCLALDAQMYTVHPPSRLGPRTT